MPLSIPREYLPAIGMILDISDASIEQLVAALSSASICAEATEMAAKIADLTPGIPFEDLTAIVDALYSLYHVREFSEVSPSRFLTDLMDTLRRNPDIGLKSEDTARIRSRFRQLLDIGTLNTLSKAIRLQRDCERLYCDAKILSDIRPVFGEDINRGPTSAVITHTLKLSYHEDEEHKEFFVVLDQQDLGQLLEVLDRAFKKAESLTELLEKSGLPRLGI
jgi:hypothetical protein